MHSPYIRRTYSTVQAVCTESIVCVTLHVRETTNVPYLLRRIRTQATRLRRGKARSRPIHTYLTYGTHSVHTKMLTLPCICPILSPPLMTRLGFLSCSPRAPSVSGSNRPFSSSQRSYLNASKKSNTSHVLYFKWGSSAWSGRQWALDRPW